MQIFYFLAINWLWYQPDLILNGAMTAVEIMASLGMIMTLFQYIWGALYYIYYKAL